MVQQMGSLAEERRLPATSHRPQTRALPGAAAAERSDPTAPRRYFNEALAGSHPRERPALRQMMKASLALAERRPDELKEAVEKLGQAPPSSRQLLMLRLMGLVAPPPGASLALRARGYLLLVLFVVALVALGFGLAKVVALPFGGVGTVGALLLGLIIVVAVMSVLTLLGRRRQARASAD